ncbi:MAG TPA: RodZ domain-containing protein [Steroidobacteraceae bacterium]|jgi:cytoskeleton protein RodZ
MDEGAAQSQASVPGARLAAAREHAGMTVLQAAERLRLDVATLEALEAGRFQTLGAAVFVRGHLRHYAELLGLPVEDIEAAYAASSARLAPQPDLRHTPTLPGTGSARGVSLPPRAALIGAIVLVLAAWVWWAMRVPSGSHRSSTSPPAASASIPSAPTVAEATPAAAAANVSPPNLAGAHSDALAGRSASAKEAASKEASKETSSKDAAAKAASVRLAVKFNEDSWLEVYDSHSVTLYRDVGEAGSERHITGSGPLHLLIGNPDGVNLELDGHPVTLKSAADSGKPQRFLLDSSGHISDVPPTPP